MNPVAVTFLALSLSLSAAHAAPPIRLALSPPRHTVEPKNSFLPGSRWVKYQVRLINDTPYRYYYAGLNDDWPACRVLLRKPSRIRWIDQTQGTITGLEYYDVAPHSSRTFPLTLPAEKAGHQLRVDLPVHASPSYQSWFERRWPKLARSEVVTIR